MHRQDIRDKVSTAQKKIWKNNWEKKIKIFKE